MTPLTPEMIERAARAIHDLMGPYLGTPEQIAKHGDRVAARQLETAEKYATVALTAALSCPDGFRLVPVEPTDEMVVQGLIGLVDEISRQLEGIEVNEAQQYMTIGAKMRNGREIKAAYRAMLAASPVSLQVKDSK